MSEISYMVLPFLDSNLLLNHFSFDFPKVYRYFKKTGYITSSKEPLLFINQW